MVIIPRARYSQTTEPRAAVREFWIGDAILENDESLQHKGFKGFEGIQRQGGGARLIGDSADEVPGGVL
jgi:hypothetical protein